MPSILRQWKKYESWSTGGQCITSATCSAQQQPGGDPPAVRNFAFFKPPWVPWVAAGQLLAPKARPVAHHTRSLQTPTPNPQLQPPTPSPQQAQPSTKPLALFQAMVALFRAMVALFRAMGRSSCIIPGHGPKQLHYSGPSAQTKQGTKEEQKGRTCNIPGHRASQLQDSGPWLARFRSICVIPGHGSAIPEHRCIIPDHGLPIFEPKP